MSDEILECQYCGLTKKGSESLCRRCRDQAEIERLHKELAQAQEDRRIIVSCLGKALDEALNKIKQLKEYQEKMSKMATPSDALRFENRALHAENKKLKEKLRTARVGRDEWREHFNTIRDELHEIKSEIGKDNAESSLSDNQKDSNQNT
jgi:chromosome segregation ATPase